MRDRYLALAAMFLVIEYFLLRAARRRIAERPGRRVGFFLGGGFLIAVGAAVFYWLPDKIPDNPGSPAKLVWSLVCWTIAATFAMGGLPVVLAAVLPAPALADDG